LEIIYILLRQFILIS